MEGQKSDKERADYVVEHIEKDLQANRTLNGIDFSEFLGLYLTACTGKRLFPTPSSTPEALQELAIFGLGRVASDLERELGKPVRFHESSKAGVAISQMGDHTELDRIDEYASKLQIEAKEEYEKVNLRAIRSFSS